MKFKFFDLYSECVLTLRLRNMSYSLMRLQP